jgi:hypothetical protein
MSYDINILVIGQETPSILPFGDIKYTFKAPKYETWQYIYLLKGVWYSLGMEEDNIFNAMPFCDSNFDVEEQNLPIPYWVKDEDVIYHLTPLIIKKPYIKEFKNILNSLLNESPEKKLLFLARYQGGNQEIIEGMVSLSQFNGLLECEKILFNVCYIIRE